jgi:predicted RNase H-like HicB family nuclease
MTAYIALLRKDAGSDYGVDFPDFPGCVAAGLTLEEARRTAAEALAFHVEGMVADGDPVPDPTDLDTIMADPANHDGIGFLVDLPSRPGRAIRLNVTLPEDLVKSIDAVTTNRSRFLAEAARQRLETERA